MAFGESISKPNFEIQEERLIAQLGYLKNNFKLIKDKLISSVKMSGIVVKLNDTAKGRYPAEEALTYIFAKLEPQFINLLDNFAAYLKKNGVKVAILTDDFRTDAETIFKNFKKGAIANFEIFEMNMTAFANILSENGASVAFAATFKKDVVGFLEYNMEPFLRMAQK